MHAAGLRVPDDVAMVGIDNTELAELATPTLTSVSLGSEERGRIAAAIRPSSGTRRRCWTERCS
jgi:LacI family transcriptional regulator